MKKIQSQASGELNLIGIVIGDYAPTVKHINKVSEILVDAANISEKLVYLARITADGDFRGHYMAYSYTYKTVAGFDLVDYGMLTTGLN